MRVTFKHTHLQGRCPPAVETAAYRIVQEALTNVARHAGVSEAAVRLRKKAGLLYVQIEDHGTGFDPGAEGSAGTSIGLTGMRERARLLGGRLTVESAPGMGTRLTAELPLAEPPRGRDNDEDDDRPGG
jgi:two-component system sensor kinase